MTIINLSGNFQSASLDNGRSLPPANSRAPSTNNNTGLSVVTKVETERVDIQLIKSKTTQVTQNEIPVEKEVKDPIEELQQFNQNIDRTLQFKIDEELGVTIVRVIDKETEELIRQFPPEELINLSRRLKELNDQDSSGRRGNTGILLQEKV